MSPTFTPRMQTEYTGAQAMKKYSKSDQQAMALWALECAERVLSLFEEAAPQDERPRRAIEVGREWVRTGVFSMPVIRGASLAAHAAAKDLKEHEAACFAAHAAGQAVATAHVPQHAYGGAYYALKAIAAQTMATGTADVEMNLVQERNWQAQYLPQHLRSEIMQRILIENRRGRFFIKLQKDADF